jgi:hypothetical protein
MVQPKIKVGHYYELQVKKECKIIFAVLYGFERGKNKDVYTLRLYKGNKDVEFPISESTFLRWVVEDRIKEITAEEALQAVSTTLV